MVNTIRQIARFTGAWLLCLLLAGVAAASVGAAVGEEVTGETEVEISECLVAQREDDVESESAEHPFALTRSAERQQPLGGQQVCLRTRPAVQPLAGLNGTGAFLRL